VAGAKYVVGGSKCVAGFQNGLWWVENGVLVARINQKSVEIFKKNTPRAQMTRLARYLGPVVTALSPSFLEPPHT
jgi:hypothetical protein